MSSSRPGQSKAKSETSQGKTATSKAAAKSTSKTTNKSTNKSSESTMEAVTKPETTTTTATTTSTVVDPNLAFMPQQNPQQNAQQNTQQNVGQGFGGQANNQKGPSEQPESIDSLLGAATSLNGAGDDLVSFHRAFEDSFKKDVNLSGLYKKEYYLIPMSGPGSQLPVDSLIIAYKEGTKVYTYTYLLAVSVSEEIRRKEWYGGQTHECTHSIGELYDDEFFSEVEKAVKAQLGNVTVTEVSGAVIPADVVSDDAVTLSRLKGNAANAIKGTLIRNNPKKRITSDWLIKTGGISYNYTATKRGVTSLDGEVCRSDVVVTLSSGAAHFQGKAHNGTSRQHARRKDELIQTAMYVDLVPQGGFAASINANINMGGFFGGNQPLNTGIYQPRVVISLSEQKCAANSLELTALSIASAALMDNFQTWASVFAPNTMDEHNKRFHDVGAIGLERNFANSAEFTPAKIMTDDPSFTDQNLLELLSQFVVPDTIFSIDIEEGGSQAWVQKVFAKATRNDTEGHKATAEIIAAFDAISGGLFSTEYTTILQQAQHAAPQWANLPLIIRDYTRVHTGKYTVRDQVRDIRDIDHLAILNSVQPGDLTPLANWTASHCPQYGTEVMLLKERERLIKTALPNATITGMARRVTINRLAVLALAQAIQKSGVSFNPDVMYQQFANNANMFGGPQGGFGGPQGGFGGFGGFGMNQQQAAPSGNRMF